MNPRTSELLRNLLGEDAGAAFARGEQPDPADVAAACARLRAELEAIASYIPGVIVRRQVAAPSPGEVTGAYWHGSILFADMSGFTALSGKLSALGKQGAEEISAIINGLFAALVAEIARYDGELFKFGGDALTAFFDARQLGAAHAAHAARAALAMQERMRAFSAIQTRAGTFQLRLRVGVHSGRVFAGEVGSLEHIELVVTGRDINRVAQAQEIAEPGEVVISRETKALLPEYGGSERTAGFFTLDQLPVVVPSSRLRGGVWEVGAGDMAELEALAIRREALRPYLAHGLPQRFLEASGASEVGEFRPVTVLFANFYPFSEALTLLGDDAGAAAAVLNAYYRRAQDVVHRYGGIVNKVDMYTRGDKLMALFGAPVANEDDPARAVRCALELREALGEANEEIGPLLRASAAGGLLAVPDEFLKQKIGINTGVVFAGQVGSALRHEYTVMGQPVNLAARLMGVGEPGSVVLSPSTRRAVESQISARDLPPVQLKGIPEPVPIAEALAPHAGAGPRAASVRRAGLVGREDELGRLTALAREALAGSGRLAAVAGEMGIGKSRLIAELVARLVAPGSGVAGFVPCLAECQSYEQNSPYATARQLLGGLLGLAGEDAAVARRVERLAAELAPALARFAPLLGDIIGVEMADTQLTASLSPEQRHDRALDLAEALVLGAARAQPTVLIVDDMHWADASSLELVVRLARQAAHAPVMLVLGYRSESGFAEPWAELEGCTRIALGELSPDGSGQLVAELLGEPPPPGIEPLLEKTQGNPLYIEAVVQSLIESGALARGLGGWHVARALSEAGIPDSIEGVITARLDRLPDTLRETVQVAAVIGRRFVFPLLDGVSLRRDDLVDRLDQLCASAIVAAEAEAAERAYHFSHALMRDVAYESILFARRRELHRRVAQQIEQLYRERLDDQITLLARHYLLAEEWASAFDYHLRAGRQAQERFASREAVALFERAIQIGHELGVRGAAPPDEQVVELYERLGALHALLGEFDTAEDRYEEALYVLGRAPRPDPAARMRLAYGLARVDEKRAQFERAFERVEQALALGQDRPDVHYLRCLLLGAGLLRRFGRYAQSLEWGDRALALAEQVQSQRDQAQALKQQGGTYRNVGDLQRAREMTERAVELFRSAQDLDGLAYAFNDLANIYTDLGQLSEARVHYESGAQLKQMVGDVYGQALIACNLGEVFRLQGEIEAAIAQYAQALTIYERIGSHYMAGVLHMNLGAAHLLRGDLVSAEAHLRPSADLFARAGAEDFLPELERYQAELALRKGDVPEARRLCEQALATAIRLEARAEEGATRRLLAEIRQRAGDTRGAWGELATSLAILREAASPHDVARALVARAIIAREVGAEDEGRAAADEAVAIYESLGAEHDLAAARAIAAQYARPS